MISSRPLRASVRGFAPELGKTARLWFGHFMMWLGLSLSSLASAHTWLESSVPAKGETLNTIPEEIVLEFHAAVKLVKVKVTDFKSGESSAHNFAPSEPAKQRYVIHPTIPAGAGNIEVSWMALGKDMHKIKGSFSFSVEPED